MLIIYRVERLWEQHRHVFYGVERLRKVYLSVLCGAGTPWELDVDVVWGSSKKLLCVSSTWI